ncbi:MAG: ABC transporter substrate-binding protein [Pleurocapsa sp.]
MTSNLPVHQQIYDRLSAIAPTVAVAWDNYDSFKNRFRYVARVLGKSDRANELIDKYQNRVQELRQAIGERIDTLRISVVYAYGRELSLINSPGDPVNEVLADVKLKLIPIQAEMAQRNQNLSFSLETLSEHDADFLFIIKYPNDTVEAVLDNPLWQQLKAVKSGQYAEISPRRWGGTSTVTANYILDDLFKYLVQDRSLDR